MQVAFWDGGGLQCFLFDIMQLGEHVGALSQFLQNADTPKFIFNAQLASQVLAHKFGITVAGVIDVGTAYQMLNNGQPLANLMDYLEWCGVALPGARAEWQKMDRNPELWAHRPSARPTLNYAVQGICSLHASYPLLSSRLVSFFGPTSLEMVENLSNQLVRVHATAGWSCRNAGLWIGEQGVPKEDGDAELDDWLSKRFSKGEGAAGRRTASPEKLGLPDLPVTAVRAEDSPRTASWRAAVAQLAAPSTATRQRSASPTLETWIARRNAARTSSREPDDQRRARRAASMPAEREPRRDAKGKERDGGEEGSRWGADGPFGIGLPAMRDFIRPDENRRAWADQEDGEDILVQLNEELRRSQAESS